MKVTLPELLQQEDILITEGAMGTMLFRAGLQQGHSPEAWNLDENVAKVRGVWEGYIKSGTQIIESNSFGGNRYRLELHGLADKVYDVNRKAAEAAVAEAEAADHPVVVAGSMGPTGQLMMPYGLLTHEDAVAAFAEQAKALADGGVSVFWIETMSDLGEVKAAVEACKQVAPEIPFVVTMTFDTNGNTMMGVTPEKAAEELSALGAIAFGSNCGNGPDEMIVTLRRMHAAKPEAILVSRANAGLPKMVDGVAVYDATPEVMAEYAREVREAGASIIGACCGSTPDHICAITEALKGD